MSEEPGKPTASVLLERHRQRDLERGYYGWEAFCIVGDYCTRPCLECRRDAAKAKKAALGEGQEQ